MGKVIGFFLLLLVVAKPVDSLSSATALEGYSAKCRRALRELDCKGLSVAIVQEDRVVFTQGFGVRDQATKLPVNDKTLFAIGSITKGMVTALLSMLVDEGKINWNDRVSDYLPDLQLHNKWVKGELRIRDLTCHWVGLRDHAGDLLFLSQEHDEILDKLSYLEPISGFRTAFAYQNLMYLAAGALIEEVTGREWEELARERLLRPMGMNETLTEVAQAPKAQNIALGHLPLNGGWQTADWRYQVDFGPAGSVLSNGWEMAQWIRLLLRPGGERRWPSWDLAALQEPQVFLPMSPWVKRLYRGAQFMGCGMGWFSYDYHGYRIVEHSGNLPGLSAKIALVPEKQIGVVVLCNQHESLLPHALVMEAFDRLLEVPKIDWIRRMALISPKPRSKRYQPRSMAVVSPNGRELVGSYHSNLIGNVEIAIERGVPILDYGRMATGELSHIAGDRYRVQWRETIPQLIPGDLPVRVVRDAKGEISGLRIEGLATFSKP